MSTVAEAFDLPKDEGSEFPTIGAVTGAGGEELPPLQPVDAAIALNTKMALKNRDICFIARTELQSMAAAYDGITL